MNFTTMFPSKRRKLVHLIGPTPNPHTKGHNGVARLQNSPKRKTKMHFVRFGGKIDPKTCLIQDKSGTICGNHYVLINCAGQTQRLYYSSIQFVKQK